MKKRNESQSNLLQNIFRCLSYFIAFTFLFFLLKRLYGLTNTLKIETISFNPFFLIMSCTLFIGYRTLRISPWLIFYRKAALKSVSLLSAWILFQLSEIGKYVPGKVGQFVGIIALCRFFKIKKAEAIVSTLLQLAFQCASGLLVGVPILFYPLTKKFSHNLLAKVLYNLPLLVGTLLLILALCFILRILLKKYLSTQNIYILKEMRSLFSLKGILQFAMIYLSLWICLGISFFLFVKSIYPIPMIQLPIIVGIYAFAWSISFMTLVTPGGLGVREGVLSVLLTFCLPPATATLVALLSRVWAICVEIILASVAWGCYYRQKRSITNIQDDETQTK